MSAVFAVFKVDRVVAVQIGTLRNRVGILRPYRTDVIRRVQSEGIRMLAETVQVRVLGELGPEPEVLRLKDQAGGRSIEQNLSGCSTRDGEGEWLFGIVERES